MRFDVISGSLVLINVLKQYVEVNRLALVKKLNDYCDIA